MVSIGPAPKVDQSLLKKSFPPGSVVQFHGRSCLSQALAIRIEKRAITLFWAAFVSCGLLLLYASLVSDGCIVLPHNSHWPKSTLALAATACGGFYLPQYRPELVCAAPALRYGSQLRRDRVGCSSGVVGLVT